MWIKKIYKYFGNTNASLDNVYDIEKVMIISKVNKTNPLSDDLSSFFITILSAIHSGKEVTDECL